MAPVSESFHAFLERQEFSPEATFTEKAIVLMVFGHTILLYSVIWWIVASRVSRGSPSSCTNRFGCGLS
ncbi:hypothetical protein N7532_004526 [Penicillium argentinense]|uniref:Uncharacterized protein n=1 Tax=Penicillium argentinense TaxID=1131581 RepID=A0A9W9KG82_9EURO|nr:uncharacterized protein N7532_004526 [Penicillium argentinense]KAJ5103997.1 hypothetical protein N7532_004526 [Penicillium argentinense]